MGHKLTLPTTLPTLSQNQIKNVENVENKETKEGGANCPICLENIGTSKTTTTVCHHSFHSTCIASWLQQHDTCPLCRSTLPPQTRPKTTYRIGQTYQIKMKNSAQFIQCGVLAVIFPPNEHFKIYIQPCYTRRHNIRAAFFWQHLRLCVVVIFCAEKT